MADFTRNAFAVTVLSQTLVLATPDRPYPTVRVINDGAANLTFFVWHTGDTILPATVDGNGGFTVRPGESAEVPSPGTQQWGRPGIVAITIIGAGVTTARIWAPRW